MIESILKSQIDNPYVLSGSYGLVSAALILGVAALCVMIQIFYERKISAWMQSRIGPNRVGPRGSLQLIADGIKLIRKEDIMHKETYGFWFQLAPMISVAFPFAALATIPFSDRIQAVDLNIGLVYIFAMTGFGVIGILMAGYSSKNCYSLIGAMRAAAQMVSYEVPMILAMLGVLCYTNTLSLRDTVLIQENAGWNIFYAPISFLIFFIAATAECNRAPFDLVEAESELVAGFHTEYSGIRFSMFFFGEYLAMIVACSLTTVMFLGGWLAPFGFNPFTPGTFPDLFWGAFWFALKTSFLLFVMMWFRWTFPRMRVDQLMEFCWKVLLPFSMANLLLMAVIAVLIK